jgi:hypothetical protein
MSERLTALCRDEPHLIPARRGDGRGGRRAPDVGDDDLDDQRVAVGQRLDRPPAKIVGADGR